MLHEILIGTILANWHVLRIKIECKFVFGYFKVNFAVNENEDGTQAIR